MELNRFLPLLIGLLLGAWTLVAAWAVLAARARDQRTESQLRSARRLARMVEESPALPLLVRSDGRIEASPRHFCSNDGRIKFKLVCADIA